MHAFSRSLYRAIGLIALCACFMPAMGQIAYAKSPNTPAPITQGLSGAREIGQARLIVYGFNIYDARLWAADGFAVAKYAEEPFALELRYLRSFKGQMIAERSLSEMRRLAPVSDEKAAQWLQNMKTTFPDIQKGDQLIGIYRPDGTASFTLNGKPIGEVRDAEFTRLFFGIWLNPKTSEPKMRSELIGDVGTSTGIKK